MAKRGGNAMTGATSDGGSGLGGMPGGLSGGGKPAGASDGGRGGLLDMGGAQRNPLDEIIGRLGR